MLGTGRPGRLEWLTLQQGSNLTDPSILSTPKVDSGESPKPELQRSWVNYAFGLSRTVADKVDLAIRIQPYAPLGISTKYQFLGESEDKAKQGDFSAAVQGGAGLLLGTSGSSNTSYYLFEGALSGGYRPWRSHLFSLSPFFTLAGLSGVSGASSGSISQYGVALGYQYSLEALFVRVEVSWLTGSYGPSSLGGYFGGAMVGFVL